MTIYEYTIVNSGYGVSVTQNEFAEYINHSKTYPIYDENGICWYECLTHKLLGFERRIRA